MEEFILFHAYERERTRMERRASEGASPDSASELAWSDGLALPAVQINGCRHAYAFFHIA